MNDNSKNPEAMSMGELLREVEKGNPQAVAYMEQLSRDIAPKLAEIVAPAANRVKEAVAALQPVLAELKEFHEQHREALEALADEKKAQAFIATVTPADLAAAVEEPTVEKVAPLLTPDGANWLEILENMEMWEAVALYEYKQAQPRQYRTRAKASSLDALPDTMPVITINNYQNAISLYQKGNAYLQPLSSVDGLKFDNGKLYFNGMPFTTAKLQQLRTKEGIENIDLPLLRTFYGIILRNFERTYTESKQLQESVKIYVPDLAAYLGKSRNISKTDIESIIGKVSSFQTVVGIVKQPKNGRIYENILPVLLFTGYNEADNTIGFTSPYMNQVIQDVWQVSIRRDKKQQPKLKKNGEPQRLPAYSYLVKSSIGKERNKKAVEIVVTVVTLIEQAGDNIPRIKASTIVERNPQLKESIDNAKSTADKNKMLKRAFTKAWELLRKQTRLTEVYQDIEIPDTVPTVNTLDIVFEFPHKGKKKTR